MNKYTATFIFGNGNEPEVRHIAFNDTIEYPKDPVREGYKFNGWKPKPRTMPASNLTVKAQWSEEIRFVEITLGTTDLSESEIKDLMEKYTDAGFTIDRLEIDNTAGSTQVIIRFEDPEEATKFVNKVREEIKRGEDPFIRDITPVNKILSISYSGGRKK